MLMLMKMISWQWLMMICTDLLQMKIFLLTGKKYYHIVIFCFFSFVQFDSIQLLKCQIRVHIVILNIILYYPCWKVRLWHVNACSLGWWCYSVNSGMHELHWCWKTDLHLEHKVLPLTSRSAATYIVHPACIVHKWKLCSQELTFLWTALEKLFPFQYRYL